MPQRHPTDARPPRPGLPGDGRQAGLDLVDVGLVLELDDAGAPLGVIAHGAAEDDHRPAVRLGHPGGCLLEREARRP